MVWACHDGSEKNDVTAQTPGVTETHIRIGSSLALEGHAGYLGTQTLHGALSYIRHINDTGGIHERQIELIAYDDGYDPPRCVANTQKLIVHDNVFCLFSYVGTPTTVKIIPLITEAKIPMVGMFTGANALRTPLNRYLINIRASYYQETGAAVQHLVETMGLTRIAVFYQYDAYGFDGLKGTEMALKRYDLIPVATGTYIRGTLNIEEGLNKIMDKGAEAVVMIGTYEPCAKFILLTKSKGFSVIFYNVSFVGADKLANLIGGTDHRIIVTQVVPPPETSSHHHPFPLEMKSSKKDSLKTEALKTKALETDPHPHYDTKKSHEVRGAVEYATLLGHYFPDDSPNFAGLEGYINAKVLVEGLKRAGKDLHREGFIDAIEGIDNLDLGIDNPLSFNKEDHQGLEQVYFTYLKNGKFVPLDE